MARSYLLTSESVSEGHPDKIADQISDAVLDAFLAEDPQARVACETLVHDDLVMIVGEFGTDVERIGRLLQEAEPLARQVIRDIGYHDAETGIDPDRCQVLARFGVQSPDISRGVDRGRGVLGAGDQGLMVGYACDETPELMPLGIRTAHRLLERQAELRKSGALPWLGPDAKSQVTVRYADGEPRVIESVVLSTQHSPEISLESLRDAVVEEIIRPVLPSEIAVPDIRYLVNPTGRFVTGGPRADTGLTGRKIIVDTYGGASPHGGGAFSGKDPTKVDRSAAYMARHLAKTVVATGLARRCMVQLAYAIGVAEPVSLSVDFGGTGVLEEEAVERALRETFDLTPAGIIKRLDLRRPIYRKTAVYGHFGRELPEFTWEGTGGTLALSELVRKAARARRWPRVPTTSQPAATAPLGAQAELAFIGEGI
jgi:S-adenosylmethionine synthetase